MTTTTEARPLRAGDRLHILSGGLLLWGEAYKRGDVLTVTQAQIDHTAWTADVSEAAQLARWGSVKLGLGPWPEGLPTWLERGDPAWLEQYQRARAEAYRQPTAELRDAALREVQRVYGGPPTTSRQLNGATTSPDQRAAEEQRRRLDAQGLRMSNTYSPVRREA